MVGHKIPNNLYKWLITTHIAINITCDSFNSVQVIEMQSKFLTIVFKKYTRSTYNIRLLHKHIQ